MSARLTAAKGSPRMAATDAYQAIMAADFLFFLTLLDGPNGQPLYVAPHHERWCRMLVENARLAILAPRDHGKSTVGAAYALWRCWRHGRSPQTGRLGGPGGGPYQIAVFGATHQQGQAFLAVVRGLATANSWLFRPPEAGSARGDPPIVWTRTRAQFASGAQIVTRAFRTSTRSLHPDVLLCDDILSDGNSGTQLQRDRSWTYFTGTLLPMHAKQVIVLGTAQHYDDVLFRLAPPDVPDGSHEPEELLGPWTTPTSAMTSATNRRPSAWCAMPATATAGTAGPGTRPSRRSSPSRTSQPWWAGPNGRRQPAPSATSPSSSAWWSQVERRRPSTG